MAIAALAHALSGALRVAFVRGACPFCMSTVLCPSYKFGSCGAVCRRVHVSAVAVFVVFAGAYAYLQHVVLRQPQTLVLLELSRPYQGRTPRVRVG